MNENLQSLKQWHKLLEEGIISQEEFDAKKNEILGISTRDFEDERKEEEPELVKDEPISEKIEMQPVAKPIQSNYKKTSQKKTSLNANQIFLIVLGGLFLVGFGFWLFRKQGNPENNKNENVQLDSAAPTDFAEEPINISKGVTKTIDKDTKFNLSEKEIIDKVIKYEIDNLNKLKSTKGSFFYDDRKYISQFNSKIENGENGEKKILFIPTYANYSPQWKTENEYKIGECVASFSILMDSSKISQENNYLLTNKLKTDLNKDDKTDYLITGYYNDCSGGSGSEGKYYFTFINESESYVLRNILITAPLQGKLSGNKLVLEGGNQSQAFYFNVKTNKWEEKNN